MSENVEAFKRAVEAFRRRDIAIGEFRTRGRASGAETTSPVAYVVDAKEGRAIRVQAYLDPADALEAAGLSE